MISVKSFRRVSRETCHATPRVPAVVQIHGWVAAEFAKQNLLQGERQNLYFWRSRSGSEVDLVIRSGGELRAFEIKWRRRRAANRAFSARYGVEVQVIDSADPLIELNPS